MENLWKGKGIKFVNNNNIDVSCLNRSKLHLNKSGTAQLVKKASQTIKPNWLFNFNDSAADKTTNFASTSNNSNVSLLENWRIKNAKNIFSYINIISTQNKCVNLCDLIFKNVGILSVAILLDPLFPNSKF